MRPGGLPIGRLLGIEVRVSPAWALLVAFVTLLGAEQAVLAAPDLGTLGQWVVGAVTAVLFLGSVLAHELAHALVARRRGSEPGPIVLGFVGAAAPMAVQARTPGAELAIAAAGPVVSLVVAFGLAGTAAVVAGAGTAGAPGTIAGGALLLVGSLNLLLGLLSLVPGLPLDGGRIVRAIAWARTHDADAATGIAARVGRLAGWTAMGAGLVLTMIGGAGAGLLVIVLGWLLASAGRALERRLRLQRLVTGLTVADALDTEVEEVPPGLTLDTFAARIERPDGPGAVLVVEDGRPAGVVGRDALRRLGRRRREESRAGEAARRPPETPFLAPGASLWAGLEALDASGAEALVVAEDGELRGLLTRRSAGTLVGERMRDARGGRG